MTGFEIAMTCLALNVFKEARGEPIEGQHAVALVTLNRVREGGTGTHICDVVFEPYQFSWTTTDSKNGVLHKNKRPDRKSAEWKRAMQSAQEALYMRDFTCGATYFHTTQINPYWASSFERVGQWGNHVFYRSHDGYQHTAEGTGRGARDPACAGTLSEKGLEGRRLPYSGEAYHSTQPEPKRSWWQRLVKYLRSLYRGEASGSTID